MEMMTLHLLILEDNPDDAELAVKELEREGFDVKWTRVDTEEAFRKALSKKPDLILVDYSVPSFDGMAALEVHRQLDLEIPLIIVSGTIGEEFAVECMKSGATDYVLKDNLSRLGPVVKRALEEMKIYRKSKQAENAIKNGESRYRYLYTMTRLMCDNLPDLIWTKDLENRFIFANKACCEKLLNTKDIDEPIGKTDIYFANREKESHPENLEYHTFGERCTDFDLVVLETKKPQRSDESGNVKGKFLHLDVYKAPFWDEKGDIIGTVGCARVVTKERQMKKTLQESEEKYRLLAENTLDCIWKMDKNLKFTYINQSIFSMLGFKPKEWIGSSLSEHCSKEEMQKIMDLIAEEMKKESYITALEMFLIHKDGREIPVEIRSKILIDNNKNLIEFQGTTLDITKRRKAEEEIRKLSSAVEQAIDGMAISDLEAKLTYVNYAFARMYGYSPEEMIGMKGVDFVKKEELDKYTSSLNKIKTLGSWTGEIEHIRKDGTPYPAFLSVNLLKDVEGSPTGILTIVKDISEQKKLEEQFRQSQKMEAIGTLAGGIAHDFNNLLTVIIGNAQLALLDVTKDESLRKEIEEIEKAGDKAASLTRQLLAFSRKQIITPRVLDLNKLLTSIEKMLARLIGEDLELLTIPKPALWQVEVDPGQMEQVIMNLAVNARDAMPMGGKLTIETANIDLAENYFHEHGIKNEPGSYVMLTVSDTGSGMDKETREHIFEPFFTTKEVGKGTGLGLSTAYGIVKQSNGFIWVYSEPGQGSTFKVYLPRVEGDADSEEKQRLPAIELGGSETILIVEDDDGLRKFAQNVLQVHGYRVLDAENGEDALRVSQEHEGPIHLMITDVVMPKMGGKEAAERLQPFYPRMKVIYMSGYTDDAIIQHGVLAPGLNFLQKPFSQEGLARKVREALE